MADERDGMTDPSTGARLRAKAAEWRAAADWMMGSTNPDEWQRGGSGYLRKCADELSALLLVNESPSCMVCGQTKPLKASHGNYPSIGVCYACHDAREILGAIVASAYRHPPEGVQPRDCALQLVPTELIVKAEALLS